MTSREKFIRTLRCEAIGGQVPTFELVFFLTMEAMGKIHPANRCFDQWDQMSKREKDLHIKDIAQIHVDIARRYDHSAIFLSYVPGGLEGFQRCLEYIRTITGDEFFIMAHGDPTLPIPDGDHMMEMSCQMYEEPEKLHDISKRNVEECLKNAERMHSWGHLLDGFAMCSDYCFNANPFYSPELFDEFIVPYLRESIGEYRKMGYYSIKHTDGNIMPIVKQMADCKPDAIHSLDPQGGVSIPDVRKIVGDDICLIGNVNCGLLQSGSDEDCYGDAMRALKEGMVNGRGYIFSTSNCAYTGLALERYEMINKVWREFGNYDHYPTGPV